MSIEWYSSLSQTLTHSPGVTIAHSRLFYSFFMKLRDLILSVFLHQNCIKLAKGLLPSVTSIWHSCHTSSLRACSVFFSLFFFYFFFPLFSFEDKLFAGEKFSLCWLIQQLSLPLFFFRILKMQMGIAFHQWCYQDIFFISSKASSSPLLISNTESPVIPIQFGFKGWSHWLLLSLI